jgi:NTE family protein
MHRTRWLPVLVLVLGASLAWGCARGTPPWRSIGIGERTVAVALGGGGARGFAEIGVLRVLEQERIPIDLVVGTSVGALVGALYADSGKVLDAEFHAVALDAKDVFDYGALSVFDGGLIRGDKLEQFVEKSLVNDRIEDMAVRFAAVAVDLGSGETVVFERGSAARAVRASAAIPGMFVPVVVGGRTLVDGAVVDPIPADIARKMGADVVIAVAIPPELRPVAPKNMVEIIHRSVMVMANEIAEARSAEADVVIRPEVGSIAFDDFSKKKELIAAGEAAAREAMPAIREALGR